MCIFIVLYKHNEIFKMKVKKNRTKLNRMLMSELINFKIYKNKKDKKKHLNTDLRITNSFLLKQAFYNFKKVLQIIFQYHFNRKKILTVGENLENKKSFYIYKKTNHVFIPKEAWVNGLLTNKQKLKKFLKKKNSLLKLIKKPRLIVSYNYQSLLDSERYQRRITDVILTHSDVKHFYYIKNPSYFLIGNFNNIRRKKLFNVFSVLIEKILRTKKIHPSCFLKISLFPKKKKIFYKKKLKKFYVLKNRIQKKSFRKKDDFKNTKKKKIQTIV